jgi:multidrug transporter EmrE-like cation transporter
MSTSNRASPARPLPARSVQASASVIPLSLGLLSIVVSVALAIWTATTAASIPVFGELRLPAASPATWPLSLGGYVLTPITVIVALGWDRAAQRAGLRDRNFILKPQYSRALRWMTGLAFVISLWHILNLAVAIASGGSAA